MQPIRTLDMFSGIGGFRSELEAIGGFSFVGHCEIDKYADQAYEAIYQPKGELYYGMDMPIKTVGVKMKNPKAMHSFHMGARVIYFTNQELHYCRTDRFWKKFR